MTWRKLEHHSQVRTGQGNDATNSGIRGAGGGRRKSNLISAADTRGGYKALEGLG